MPENPEDHPALGRVDEALSYLPMIELDEDRASRFANGQFIATEDILHSDIPLDDISAVAALESGEAGTVNDRELRDEPTLPAEQRFRVLGPEGLVGVGYLRSFTEGRARLAAERVFQRANE